MICYYYNNYTRGFTGYINDWVNGHRRFSGTTFLSILETRCLNLMQNYYVLISKLIAQIPILLGKLFLIPNLASTFLTFTSPTQLFCSGFSGVSTLSFSASLAHLYIYMKVWIFYFYSSNNFTTFFKMIEIYKCIFLYKNQPYLDKWNVFIKSKKLSRYLFLLCLI